MPNCTSFLLNLLLNELNPSDYKNCDKRGRPCALSRKSTRIAPPNWNSNIFLFSHLIKVRASEHKLFSFYDSIFIFSNKRNILKRTEKWWTNRCAFFWSFCSTYNGKTRAALRCLCWFRYWLAWFYKSADILVSQRPQKRNKGGLNKMCQILIFNFFYQSFGLNSIKNY